MYSTYSTAFLLRFPCNCYLKCHIGFFLYNCRYPSLRIEVCKPSYKPCFSARFYGQGTKMVINPSRKKKQGSVTYISSFNARSIVNKRLELQSHVALINPDIIAITETWLHEGIADNEILPSSYNVLRNDRGSRGGGVLLAVKSNISCSRRPDLEEDIFIFYFLLFLFFIFYYFFIFYFLFIFFLMGRDSTGKFRIVLPRSILPPSFK